MLLCAIKRDGKLFAGEEVFMMSRGAYMRAVIFERFGEVEVRDIEVPKKQDGFSLIRVIEATLNPIDIFTIMGKRDVRPIPHIPGVEIYGEVVDGVHRGRRVLVYPRLFCGGCRYCLSEKEMLCTGELFGVATNGGFSEFCLVPDANVFPIDDGVPSEIASSLPVGALTAYHALGHASFGDRVAIIGATGNTGMFSVQIAKMKGCEVFAVTRRKSQWLRDLGADEIIAYDQLDRFRGYFDVVIDPLGEKTLARSIELVGKGGKIVIFGILTGRNVSVDLFDIYSREVKIVGATGGSRSEFLNVIGMASRLKVKVWKRVKLWEFPRAVEDMSIKEGKITVEIA